MTRRPDPIRVADTEVSILAACRLIGMDLPPGAGEGRNVKVHCPFGEVHHADGGVEPAMRLYVDSNHVHCFAGCGHFKPSALVAHAFDLTRGKAAAELLARTGYQPPLAEDVWRDDESSMVPDTDRLAEALKTFCRRTDENWDDRQFEPAVAQRLSRCLGLLPFVRDEWTAEEWLHGCKAAMIHVLSTSGRET